MAMTSSVLRKGLLTLACVLGLSACLTSDPPKLDAEDLSTPKGIAGSYYATKFSNEESEGPDTVDGVVEAMPDRTYRLTLIEGDHKDAPIVIRLLTLNDGRLLAALNEIDKDLTVYATVTFASNGAWVFRLVNLAPAARSRTVREAMMRHGATGVKFDQSQHPDDAIAGQLTAANLRALFSDRDFLNALEDAGGFRLSPKP